MVNLGSSSIQPNLYGYQNAYLQNREVRFLGMDVDLVQYVGQSHGPGFMTVTKIRPVYKGTGARHETMVRRSIDERLHKCVVHYRCTFTDRWRTVLGDSPKMNTFVISTRSETQIRWTGLHRCNTTYPHSGGTRAPSGRMGQMGKIYDLGCCTLENLFRLHSCIIERKRPIPV
jgi:hypothetical protein